MSVQGWTFLIVGITFAIYIGIAIWSRAGSTKEFYVAGGGVPPLANGMATAADWMSAASFISMAGLISFLGYDGSVYLMGWTGGYVLLALLLAPYLRKFGKFTVPDFVGDRYESQVARIVAVICALFVSFTYVAGQMRGVGIVFGRFLEVPVEWGIVIGISVLPHAVLAIESVHEHHVHRDEHEEDVDRALLGEPEAELRLADPDLVQRLDQQDPAPERDGEPHQEQAAQQPEVGAPVALRVGAL